VVKWIAKRIVSGLSGEFDRIGISQSFGSPSHKKINSTFMDFQNSLAKKLSDLQDGGNDKKLSIRWANGGAAYGEWYLESNSSPAPTNPVEKRLVDIIEKREVEEKYFLSPNAAKGILRRVNRQGRILFRPLNEALERLAENGHAGNGVLDSCNKMASA